MAITNSEKQIVQQDLALDSYLQTLLEELPQIDLEEELPESKLTKPETLVKYPEIDLAPKIDIPEVRSEKPRIETPSIIKNIEVSQKPIAVMPEWSQQEFQAIYFKIGELILATPLTELSRTLKFDRLITKIPGQPDWFLGLLEDQQKKIGILDAGQLILGKKYGITRNFDQQPYKSMLVTQDENWALACDDLLSIGKVEPEKVRWRTNRQQKPWLIGTVVEDLTAVIDVNQLTPRRRKTT